MNNFSISTAFYELASEFANSIDSTPHKTAGINERIKKTDRQKWEYCENIFYIRRMLDSSLAAFWVRLRRISMTAVRLMAFLIAGDVGEFQYICQRQARNR